MDIPHHTDDPNEQFEELLTSDGETMLKIFYAALAGAEESGHRGRRIARALGLTFTQLVCAVGFNPRIRDLPDVAAILGFEDYDELAQERNLRFASDVYKRLGINNVLAVYAEVPKDMKMLDVMQYLLGHRLERIEARIEATVNSIVIERYKKEITAIYRGGVAQVDFAESRLAKTDSGFRALLGEVSIIVEARMMPIGDIFFRDTVLPEEKRRLIARGFIPRELIEERLAERDVPEAERTMLEEQLRQL